MKRNILFFAMLFASMAFAQNVGIGTQTPERELDVNGNLRVKDAEDVSLNENYDQVMVLNGSNGDVDYMDKSNFGPFKGKDKFNSRIVPIADNNKITTEVTIGCLSIRFDKRSGVDGQIQYKTCRDEKVIYANDSQSRGAGYLDEHRTKDVKAGEWNNATLYNFKLGVKYEGIFALFNSTTMYKVDVASPLGKDIAISVNQILAQ